MKTGWLACITFMLLSVVAHAKIRVVATLPSLAAIAAEVGGEWVDTQSLAAATEDPHFVDPRPNLMLALNRADLLIATGLELEGGWLPPLQLAARNPKIQSGARGYIEAAQFVSLLEVPTGRIDRSMGDLHPGGNPHFLNEPQRVAQVAVAVGQRLAELDAAHAAAYGQNARSFAESMRAFGQRAAERFKALPAERRQVVTYHKSMAYLLDWLALREVATVEPRPGVSPDPSHVAAVLTRMRESKVMTLVQEEFYPTSNSKTLATLAKARLVIIRGGVRFSDKENYLDYFTRLTGDLYSSLAP